MIGIIGAMEEEVGGLKMELTKPNITRIAGMLFYRGQLFDKEVVIAQCGVGKVNAASCTQIMNDYYHVACVINTGIAGAISENVKVGSFVVSEEVCYHDVDVQALLYEDGQVPGMPLRFKADKTLVNKAFEYLDVDDNKVLKGLIVTGDQFIDTLEKRQFIKERFNPLCADMESAAIAHVCYMNGIPFVIVRSISDNANGAINEYEVNEEKMAIECINAVRGIVYSM